MNEQIRHDEMSSHYQLEGEKERRLYEFWCVICRKWYPNSYHGKSFVGETSICERCVEHAE